MGETHMHLTSGIPQSQITKNTRKTRCNPKRTAISLGEFLNFPELLLREIVSAKLPEKLPVFPFVFQQQSPPPVFSPRYVPPGNNFAPPHREIFLIGLAAPLCFTKISKDTVPALMPMPGFSGFPPAATKKIQRPPSRGPPRNLPVFLFPFFKRTQRPVQGSPRHFCVVSQPLPH